MKSFRPGRLRLSPAARQCVHKFQHTTVSRIQSNLDVKPLHAGVPSMGNRNTQHNEMLRAMMTKQLMQIGRMSSNDPNRTLWNALNEIHPFHAPNGGDPKLPVEISRPGTEPNGIIEKGLQHIRILAMQKLFPAKYLKQLTQQAISYQQKHDQTTTNTPHDHIGEIEMNPETFQRAIHDNLAAALEHAIKMHALAYVEKNQHLVTDEPSKAHLALCSLVISSYKVLTQKYDMKHEDAIQILGTCVSQNVQEWLKAVICLPLYVKTNPIPALRGIFETEARMRGDGFDWELHEDAMFKSFMNANVKKCFFNDFFRKNGASYLTGLFCAAEQRMFAQYNQPTKYNIRFELKATLAAGNPHCSFQFKKMEPMKNFPLPSVSATMIVFAKGGPLLPQMVPARNVDPNHALLQSRALSSSEEEEE